MAKKILIKWNPPNLYRCGDLRLIPGVNEVSADIWNGSDVFLPAKDNPGVKERLTDGRMELVGVPKAPPAAEGKPEEKLPPAPEDEGNAAESLAEYNAADAKDLVKETLDPDTLKEWREQETRKSVLTAIDEQIEMLEAEEG